MLSLGLMVFALAECVQSDDQERAGLHKGIWIVLIVIFPLAGSIAWLVVSRSHRTARRPRSGWGPAMPPAPTAPDDDPEFLWRLESNRRRAATGSAGTTPPRESRPTGPAADGPASPGSDRPQPEVPDQGDGAS